jgi:integrase
MYGGLRVGEACSVRVMDEDLDRLQLTVRRGKGDKNRMTPLSERLAPPPCVAGRSRVQTVS